MNTMYGVTEWDNLWHEIEARARNNYGDWNNDRNQAENNVRNAIESILNDIEKHFSGNDTQIESIALGMCE